MHGSWQQRPAVFGGTTTPLGDPILGVDESKRGLQHRSASSSNILASLGTGGSTTDVCKRKIVGSLKDTTKKSRPRHTSPFSPVASHSPAAFTTTSATRRSAFSRPQAFSPSFTGARRNAPIRTVTINPTVDHNNNDNSSHSS